MLKSKKICLADIISGLEDALHYGRLRKRNLGSPIPAAGGREADTRV
jgi:hypothetical protein